MPKLKTKRAAAARFRVTGSGKIMRMYGGRNNMRRKKRQPIGVLMGRTVPVSPAMAPTVRRMLAGQ
ncbi:MAG: bL35 family ribosomal protein [Dehalococcoidia bacterium]